jgi:hypothetical protein
LLRISAPDFLIGNMSVLEVSLPGAQRVSTRQIVLADCINVRLNWLLVIVRLLCR